MANSTLAQSMNGLSSNALFQTFMQNVTAALSAIGLVQTSDTGQVNTSTAVRPSAGAYAGYQVWRFNDAAQSTCPFFIKIWYGAGANGQQFPRLLFQFGKATDGAGTLTGLGVLGTGAGTTYPSTHDLVVMASGSSTGTGNFTFSGDGSGICITLPDASSSSDRFIVLVDRFRDDSGAATDKGVTLVHKSGVSSPTSTTYDRVRNRVGYLGSRTPFVIPAPLTAGNAWLTTGGDPAPFGGWVSVPEQYAIKMGVAYNYADVAAATNTTVTHLGAARTYRAYGGNITTVDYIAQSASGFMQWWSD